MNTITNMSRYCLNTLFIISMNATRALVNPNDITKKHTEFEKPSRNVIIFHPHLLITRSEINHREILKNIGCLKNDPDSISMHFSILLIDYLPSVMGLKSFQDAKRCNTHHIVFPYALPHRYCA